MPIWTYRIIAALFTVAMSSCVDNVICVERMTTIQSCVHLLEALVCPSEMGRSRFQVTSARAGFESSGDMA